METLEKISEQISQNRTEIANLEAKHSELDEKIFEIKKDANAILTDDKEIQGLATHRDLVVEAIKDRTELLEALEVQLAEAEAEQEKKGKFELCVNLTKESHEARVKYFSMLKELDEELYPKLLAIKEVKNKWYKSATEFMRTADEIAPGFRVGTSTNSVTPEEDSENRKAFLEQVEAAAGVSTFDARTDSIITYRYFNEVTSGSNHKEYWPETRSPIARLADDAREDESIA